MDEMVYWIWLSLCCTPDTATFPKLLSHFDGAKAVYDADDKEISRAIGYNSSDRAALLDKSTERAEKIYAFCKRHNVGLLAYPSEAYPNALREIPTPPVLLYYRGVLPDFNRELFVAAVGTRSLSSYGRKSAFSISHDLASAGAIVVSGMATGIDGVALAGALSAGGRTVAVIGSGIDICYPAQHQRLAREIVKGGCVLTEFAPGTKPERYNFPKRNRIISGLSAATLVFEGRERSGALITARCAKAQGRAVYAFPGNVGAPQSELSNLLIKDGARLFTCADDIVRDFTDTYPGVLNPFSLSTERTVDMMATLTELSVVCLCPDDPVLRRPPVKRGEKKQEEPTEAPVHRAPAVSEPPTAEQTTVAEPPVGFDAEALKLYKRIPFTGDIAIESLVEEGETVREVMRRLLKLEMGRFVVMLPGDRVARKTK